MQAKPGPWHCCYSAKDEKKATQYRTEASGVFLVSLFGQISFLVYLEWDGIEFGGEINFWKNLVILDQCGQLGSSHANMYIKNFCIWE